jgi:hypothetical protein
LNDKKITKINYNKGLRWLPFDILHATTIQKQASVTEGGWNRPHDHARTLRERDGNGKPFAEGNNDNNDECNKDSNIPNNNVEYKVGLTVLTSPSTRPTMSMKLSALPPRRALTLRVSSCQQAALRV